MKNAQTMLRITMLDGEKHYEVLSRESVLDTWTVHDLHSDIKDAFVQRDLIKAGFIKA